MGCTCSRAAKLTASPLLDPRQLAWLLCTLVLGRAYLFHLYLSLGWQGAGQAAGGESREQKIGRAARLAHKSSMFGPSGMRGHEGGLKGEGGNRRGGGAAADLSDGCGCGDGFG